MADQMKSSYDKARKSMGYGKGPSPSKARQMLHDGTAQGQPLSKKQRGLFGAIASGQKRKK